MLYLHKHNILPILSNLFFCPLKARLDSRILQSLKLNSNKHSHRMTAITSSHAQFNYFLIIAVHVSRIVTLAMYSKYHFRYIV